MLRQISIILFCLTLSGECLASEIDILLAQIPVEPFAFVALRQSKALADLAQGKNNEGQIVSSNLSNDLLLLKKFSPGLGVVLNSILTAPGMPKPIEAVCALLPSDSLFGLPRLVLFLRMSSLSRKERFVALAKVIASAEGKLMQPLPEKGIISSKSSAIAIGLRQGTFFLTEDTAYLKQVLAQVSKRQQTTLIRLAAGKVNSGFRLWCDPGKIMPLLRLFKLVPEGKVFAEEIAGVRSVSLGLGSDARQNKLVLYLEFKQQTTALTRLLQLLNAELEYAESGKDKESGELSVSLHLAWSKVYPAIWQLLGRIRPQEVYRTIAAYDALALLTGIHVKRDFFVQFTGEIEFNSVLSGMGIKHRAVFDIREEKTLRAAFKRASIWSSWFASHNQAERFFSLQKSKNGKDYWLLQGNPGAVYSAFALRKNRLFVGESQFVAEKKELSSNKITTYKQSKNLVSRLNLRISPGDTGVLASLIWKKDRHLKMFLLMLEDTLFTLRDSAGIKNVAEPISVAVPALRQIIQAETVFRCLNLGGLSGLSKFSFEPRYWLLSHCKDSLGKSVELLPSKLTQAREGGIRALRGVVFAPVKTISGEKINWQKECVFAASSSGLDGTEPAVYVVTGKGVVYKNSKISGIPVDIPRDLEAAGWQAVTNTWE